MKDISKWVVYAGVFAVPFIPLIIANSMFFPFITGKNFTFRIIVEIIFAAWLILMLYEPQFRPRVSWVLGGLAALVGVMFFATIFSESPAKSFWSNFERMEGYITLIHVFLYFIVVGSVLTTEKIWSRFFNTSLAAAVIVALYAFSQLSGNIEIRQGGWRLDATLGNSAYMAVYMLFHIFIAAFMFVRTESKNLRYVYGALFFVFIFLLVQTATRGAILGFVGGSVLATLYIAIFAKSRRTLRKVAAGAFLVIVVLAGLFVAFRDSSVIQGNPYLGRVANISLSEGDVRFKIWGMAVTGVEERPIVGWGQGNFNYLFNRNYEPSLWNAESWYDRVHNIALDWLVAGGILGFIAYLSILLAALYYVFLRPLITPKDETFTVVERGLLLGLLAAYTFHNLFVFDNIISYIFYASILAFIHYRAGYVPPKLQNWKIEGNVIEQVAAPVVGVILLVTIYFLNVPGIQAAGDIIDAFQAQNPQQSLNAFERALSRDSFGSQEIREQMTRQAQSIFNSDQASPELKEEVSVRVEEELLAQISEKPGDARTHVFTASFYRMIGDYEKASEQLAIARSLSPKKQEIIFEQGMVELQRGNNDEALAYYKEAYELSPENPDAHIQYAIAGLYTGDDTLYHELINTEQLQHQFALNDVAVQAAYNTQQYDLLHDMFTYRIERSPQDPQLRTNLAVVLHEAGSTTEAIEVLNKAAEDIPTFEEQANQFIATLLSENPSTVPQGEATPAE